MGAAALPPAAACAALVHTWPPLPLNPWQGGLHQHSGRGPTRAFAMMDLRKAPKGDWPATLAALGRMGAEAAAADAAAAAAGGPPPFALSAAALLAAAAGVRQPSGSAVMIWSGTLACACTHGHVRRSSAVVTAISRLSWLSCDWLTHRQEETEASGGALHNAASLSPETCTQPQHGTFGVMHVHDMRLTRAWRLWHCGRLLPAARCVRRASCDAACVRPWSAR